MMAPKPPAGSRAVLGRRDGQVAILFAVVIVPLLMAILALTVDVGYALYTRARLQNAADAAVLAAAQVVLRDQCAGLEESASRNSALAEAQSLKDANCPGAGLTVEFGYLDEHGAFVLSEAPTPARAVRAKAYRNAQAPEGRLELFFASLWGKHECDVMANATAEVACSINAAKGALTPFGVPYKYIEEFGLEPYDPNDPENNSGMVFYPCDGEEYDEIADTVTVPGCFGLLNLDGGDLSTTEIIEWITNGYPGEVELDPETGSTWIGGTSGFRAAMQKPLRDRIGDEIIVMIYDEAINQGANASFEVIGFMAGTLTGCRLTGKDPYIEFTITEIALHQGISTGNATPSPNIRKVQLVD
jgi:hypothetical protein